MLRNYFITTFRHLLNHKSISVINVLGLALGITCALVILMVVRYERSFDRFHSHADRIYRVVRTGVGDDPGYRTGVSYPLTEAIRTELTSAEQVAATLDVGGVQVDVYDEEGTIRNRFQGEAFGLVEPEFFDIFDFAGTGFRWVAGDPATALTEPFTLVLTQSLAKKYFSNEDALGRTLRIKIPEPVDCKVTGVISDLPANTDFPFQLIGSYASLKPFLGEGMNDWYSVSDDNQCFVRLHEGVSEPEAEAQIAKVHAGHVDEKLASTRLYPLQPLLEMHSDARFGNYKRRTVSQETIGALILIGFFLLLTACINFVNLATAQAVVRSKEVGIRKVLGSRRRQLTTQFLSETFILTFVASLLALGTAELVTIYGSALLQIPSDRFLITTPFILGSLALMVLIVTLAAGFYPALVQSGCHPIAAIKNKIATRTRRGFRLRSGLVVLQFIISQVFIIGTLVIIRQMDYFKNADLGFDQEAVVTVSVPELSADLPTLRNQWEEIAAVQQVSFSSSPPSGMMRNSFFEGIRRKSVPEGEEGFSFELQYVDEHYLDLYQIPLIAGRNFLPSDTAQSIIINQMLSKRAGFATPAEAVGEEMWRNDQLVTVVGVIENFHTNSLKEGVDMVGLIRYPGSYLTASIKLDVNPDQPSAFQNLQQTLASVEQAWTASFPEYVFDYSFLNANIAHYYQEEARLTQLFKLLAGVTIFIGCLGLYGLVAFMAVRRTKEVGVRKVLGASVQHILVLFSKEFVYLILIAFCVAGPVAWYVMRLWLQNFTYRIDLEIGTFLIAIVASLLIALLTVSYQAIKTATANPVDSLRSE